jgi:hypothetical protein
MVWRSAVARRCFMTFSIGTMILLTYPIFQGRSVVFALSISAFLIRV